MSIQCVINKILVYIIKFNLLNKVNVRMIATWPASYTTAVHRMQPQRAPLRIITHAQYHMANQFHSSNKQVKDKSPTLYLSLIPRLPS